jgi:molecular chaperone DnaK (HSP70)
MKRYIAARNPGRKKIDGKEISHLDAGRDFLSAVITLAGEEVQINDEEIALTVPVETFEDYENWISEVAEDAGMPRFRVIDEPSAAALGYGAHIQPGDVYLTFDFGGGTLDVAVILIEEEDKVAHGRRCRVLGKAGSDIGGSAVDGWLYQEILRRTGRTAADPDILEISNRLLMECEVLKEKLSFEQQADLVVINPDTGVAISTAITREEFEGILDQQNAFTQIDRTIRRALNDAHERGYDEDNIKSVLMVGGSSQIPSVKKMLKRIFGDDRVLLNRPLDAVARGAAAFVAGIDFYDHIHHDYAIRHVNRETGDYDYRPIVRRGTPYPTEKPVARLTIKASHGGQTQLGIVVFEIGYSHRKKTGNVEIQFDPSGAARLVDVTPEEEQSRRHFQVGNPTFLTVDPPAEDSEGCYETYFGIDGNKRLLVSARNIRTGEWAYRDYPMVKLT